MSNSSDDNTYYETSAKINRIIDKQFLKEGGTIDIDNYEIVKGPQYSIPIFRKKNNKKCYIEFNLNYEGKNIFMLHIDIFLCTNDVKGAGLKMLVALVRYIRDKALENGLNNESSIIQLSAEPLLIGRHSNDLFDLVLYYIKIGFNIADDDVELLPREIVIKYLNGEYDKEDEDEIEIENENEDENENEITQFFEFETNIREKKEQKITMETKINDFLDLHRDLLVGGKKKNKRKTKKIKKIKRRETKRI
jgi:hypothetical protein